MARRMTIVIKYVKRISFNFNQLFKVRTNILRFIEPTTNMFRILVVRSLNLHQY